MYSKKDKLEFCTLGSFGKERILNISFTPLSFFLNINLISLLENSILKIIKI